MLLLAIGGVPIAGAQRAPQANEEGWAFAPRGLTVLWRIDRLEPGSSASRRTLSAYSPDGRLIALADWAGVRVLEASSGTLVRKVPGEPNREPGYALAVSSAGAIALGRLGGVELHAGSARDRVTRPRCAGACGPVTAIAFSPDGALLAFQGARGLSERRQGLGTLTVVSTHAGVRVASLEATTARARVQFSADGRTVFASGAARLDDHETFGLHAWDVASWSLARTVRGAERPSRAFGLDGARPVAVYERGGNVELHELGVTRPLWSVPLIEPALDAAWALAPGAPAAELVEVAANGNIVVSYETRRAGGAAPHTPGTIVIRRTEDGAVLAMYDVAGVADLSIAPNGDTFAFTAAAPRRYTLMARVP